MANNLAVYDSTYFSLAVSRTLAVATVDGKLQIAAKNAGLERILRRTFLHIAWSDPGRWGSALCVLGRRCVAVTAYLRRKAKAPWSAADR